MSKKILSFAICALLFSGSYPAYAKTSSPSDLCTLGMILTNLTSDKNNPTKVRFATSKKNLKLKTLLKSLTNSSDKAKFTTVKTPISDSESIDINIRCLKRKTYIFNCIFSKKHGVVGCTAR